MINIVRESAAKLDKMDNYREGSETIPKGSTLINPNINGSARPLANNVEGEEIVHRNDTYKELCISLAIKKFSNKFDYSKVVYTNIKTKVCIICPEHGEFLLSMQTHLGSKYGCPLCAKKQKQIFSLSSYNKIVGTPTKTSIDEYIKKARHKYNNKYDYIIDIDKWTGECTSNIKIICPEHGEFILNAHAHILHTNNTGCILCANKKRARSKTLSYEQVLEKIYAKYSNKYLIPAENKETYVNTKSILKIICPEHGVFYKRTNKFLLGLECHSCKIYSSKKAGLFPGGYYTDEWFNETLANKELPAKLYYFRITNLANNVYYKIGITKNNTIERIKHLKFNAKLNNELIDIEVLAIKNDTLYNVYKIELEILLQYKEYRLFRKWSTELFNVDIYEFIRNYF